MVLALIADTALQLSNCKRTLLDIILVACLVWQWRCDYAPKITDSQWSHFFLQHGISLGILACGAVVFLRSYNMSPLI